MRGKVFFINFGLVGNTVTLIKRRGSRGAAENAEVEV